MSSTERATKLREEGNHLYRSGKLVEAIHKYRQSFGLNPSDSAPLRNLSAAYYEVGIYKECIAKAEQALPIIRAAGEKDMLLQIQKLEARIDKAKAHSRKVSSAIQLQRRRKIVQNLPRYRGTMSPDPEYYIVGHDVATSIFDTSIQMANPDVKQFSFLFGGVGDSRHLLSTISELAKSERDQEISKRLYHFTVNDINNYAIARDLIVWILLQDLSETDGNSNEADRILNTLFFVYLTIMMPDYAFRHLHQTIDKAHTALEAGKQPLKWVYLHKEHIPVYLRALEMWKGRALTIFTNSKVIETVIERMRDKRETESFIEKTLPVCKKEKLLYCHSAVIYPSKRILELADPEMRDLLHKFSQKPKANSEKFKRHLKDHWHVNTTLISPDWYDALICKNEYDLFHDPFDAIEGFYPFSLGQDPAEMLKETEQMDRPAQLFEYIAPFFNKAAKALRFLNSRLQVEVIYGELVDVCEKLRFGLFQKEDHKRTGATGFDVRPKDFPVTFDRIHLSNVPDYIGGHLTTCLYVAPLLKRQFSSCFMSNCLRNTPVWSNVEAFLAEYQCITDDKMLEKLTSVQVLLKGNPPYPMADYMLYGPSETLKHSFADLIPRKAFQKWFYALFFKIALPFNCDIRKFTLIIYQPLNLTVLFRLVRQLRLIGYPCHWIAEALANILEDKVMTTARPAWRLPMTVSDVERDHPEKRLTTAPFRQEVATLAQLFSPLLPFSSLAEALPPLSTIHAYTFTFPSYVSEDAQQNNLLLVFYNPTLFPSMPSRPPSVLKIGFGAYPPSLRPLLDPSPETDPPFCEPQYTRFREQGIACWTTFKWDCSSRVAKAWLPEAFATKLISEGWCCALWRVDLWCPVAGGGIGGGEGMQKKACLVANIVVKGEAWSDGGATEGSQDERTTRSSATDEEARLEEIEQKQRQ